MWKEFITFGCNLFYTDSLILFVDFAYEKGVVSIWAQLLP